MTTEVEAATKTLNSLMDQREQLVARSGKLTSERQKISYSAHTGDKNAKERLRKINDEAVFAGAELESIAAAITEAQSRLATAQRDEAQQADRTNAEQLRIKLNRFCELATYVDEALADAVSASNEMSAILNDMAQLGCTSPNATQLRVLGTIAIKSFVMQVPWTAREWEHLPPGQRRTLGSFVSQWRDQITNNVNARLGQKETEAA